MKSKKLLSFTLSALMVVPTVMPIMANDEKSTTVSYEVEQSYEWSIHSAIDFGSNAGVNQTVEKTGNVVSVTENVIPVGGHLNISVSGDGTDGAFVISDGQGTNLEYSVYKGTNSLVTGENVLSVEAGTNTDSVSLDFVLDTGDNESEMAGDYSGTVTYTATVVEEHTHNYVSQTQMIEHQICGNCNADLNGLSQSEISAHMKAHALNGDGNKGYHSEWREEVTSYKCSICGYVISVDEYKDLTK